MPCLRRLSITGPDISARESLHARGSRGGAAAPAPAWLLLGRKSPFSLYYYYFVTDFPLRNVFQLVIPMHPLRQHTGICNSRSARGGLAGGWGGVQPPVCFASLFFFLFWFFFSSFPFFGGVLCYVSADSNQRQRGGRQRGSHPRSQPPNSAWGNPGVRAWWDGRGCGRGPRGEDWGWSPPWLSSNGGATAAPPPL